MSAVAFTALGGLGRALLPAFVSFGLSRLSSYLLDKPHQARAEPAAPGPSAVEIQTGANGGPIPLAYGRTRLAGTVIWLGGARESTSYQELGDGVGVTIYHVRLDLAIGLCAGPIAGVRQVWLGSTLIYDAANSPSEGVRYVHEDLRFYDGAQDQDPDPLLAAGSPAGCPAYRGLAYLVIEGLELYAGSQPLDHAIGLPQFEVVLEGQEVAANRPVFSRPSPALSLRAAPLARHAPIADPLPSSAWESDPDAGWATVGATTAGFDDASTQWSYEQIVADGADIAADYPSLAVYESAGQSVEGREIGCLRLADDGARPILLISQGIHGDERAAAAAISRFARDFCGRSVNAGLRRLLSVFVILAVNPDGMAAPDLSEYGGTGKRDNANGVNLNRNWPNYWAYTLDDSKGASPASEPETQAIMAWLDTPHPVTGATPRSRVIVCVDVHGWNSRTTLGFLTEQEYFHIRAQRTQRGAYLWAAGRVAAATWNTPTTWVNGPPALTEYRSTRKPYLYTWVKAGARSDAWCGIVEYSQHENVGATCQTLIHVLNGFLCAAADALEPELGGTLLAPALTPLNQNPLFESWVYDVTDRPAYFRTSGLRLARRPVGPARSVGYLVSERPADAGWPAQISHAAYCLVHVGHELDRLVRAGGETDTGVSASSHGERLDTGAKTFETALPQPLRDAAMATHSGLLYLAGGHTGSAYSDAIYRRDALADVKSPWSMWGTLAAGAIQRHTLSAGDYPYLYLAGGRDAGGYLSGVWRIDVSTGAQTQIADLATARGWHTACVHAGTLYVFGGWNGSNTLASVEKVDLATGAVSAGTPLPFSRAEQALAAADGSAWLAGGRSGSSYFSTIYRYDLAADTIEQISYDLPSVSDEQGATTSLPSPALCGMSAFIHPVDGYLALVGGVDESAVHVNRFYELDLDTYDLLLRETDAASWGYLRISTTFTAQAGDSFTLQAAVRAADPVSEEINPYLRLAVLIGPLSALQRKLRLGYTIPPQDRFHTFTLPFTLAEGESEFRCYLRHYGGGTRVHVAGMALLPGPVAGVLTSAEGKAADSLAVTFKEPLKTSNLYSARAVAGMASPVYGSQQPGTYTLLDFQVAPDTDHAERMESGVRQLAYLRLQYVGWEDYSNGEDAGSGLVAYPPTGKFTLQWGWTDNDSDSQDLLVAAPLNHARLNREWRRDLVYWRLEGYAPITTPWQQAGLPYSRHTPQLTFSLFFYGQREQVTLASTLAKIQGFSTGVGAVIRTSRNLADVLRDLCERAGVPSNRIDTSGVADTVYGYLAANRSSARSHLEVLMSAFHLDLVESGGELRFVKRDQSPAYTLTEDDLVPDDDGQLVKIVATQPAELPSALDLIYYDLDKQYEQGTQRAMRGTVAWREPQTVSLPITLTAQQAARIAEGMLYTAWTGRRTYELVTTRAHAALEPGDSVRLVLRGLTHTLGIRQKTEQPDGAIRFVAISYDADMTVSTATGDPGLLIADQVLLPGSSVLTLFEAPPLVPSEATLNQTGLYLAAGPASAGTWPGCAVNVSDDGGTTWRGFTTLFAPAIQGTTLTALGAGVTRTVPDYSASVEVQLFDTAAQLESLTTLGELLAGGNACRIGEEILHFQSAELLGAGHYRLTGLLRGAKGTDHAMAGHAEGERFVLLEPATVKFMPLAETGVGASRTYRVSTIGQDVAEATTQSYTLTNGSLLPLAPTNVRATRNADGDIALAWTRRDRICSAWLDHADLCNSEGLEEYRVEVMDGPAVARTVTVTSPAWTYAASAQTSDFGALQDPVTVRIAQQSARSGHGRARTATV